MAVKPHWKETVFPKIKLQTQQELFHCAGLHSSKIICSARKLQIYCLHGQTSVEEFQLKTSTADRPGLMQCTKSAMCV